jgi:hypothetical protein
MKIIITPQAREKITELRGHMAALLAKESKSDKELNRLNGIAEGLRGKIAALDAKPDLTDAQAMALAGKRIQLEKTEAQRTTLETSTENQSLEFTHVSRETLMSFRREATAATGPAVEAYMATIQAAFRPFYYSDDLAKGAAFTSAAAGALMAITHRLWGAYVVNKTEVKAALAHADNILSGEIPFTFDPGLKK